MYGSYPLCCGLPLEVEEREARRRVRNAAELAGLLPHEDLERRTAPALEEVATECGAVASPEAHVRVHPGSLLCHREIAQEGENFGLVLDEDALVLLALEVVEPDDGVLEGTDPGELGGPDAFATCEGGKRLDDLLALLEAKDEGPLRILAEKLLPQGTASQAATFGWSLSTAPTCAAPPGEV